jgi:hypothetical protein
MELKIHLSELLSNSPPMSASLPPYNNKTSLYKMLALALTAELNGYIIYLIPKEVTNKFLE